MAYFFASRESAVTSVHFRDRKTPSWLLHGHELLIIYRRLLYTLAGSLSVAYTGLSIGYSIGPMVGAYLSMKGFYVSRSKDSDSV